MARTALVTGVGRRRGIGAGIAASLATDGWDLALSFWRPYDDRLGLERQPDDPEQLAAELRQLGRKVELVPADLEDPVAATTLVLRAEEQLGPLNALVMSHCEGVNSGVLDTTVASFDRHGQVLGFEALSRGPAGSALAYAGTSSSSARVGGDAPQAVWEGHLPLCRR